MTDTYLVLNDDQPAWGTRRIEARTEAEALTVAQQCLGAGSWRVVGIVAAIARTPLPTYDPILASARDPLEGED